MKEYVLDENEEELTGVIGFDEDGYIFDEDWLEELMQKTKEEK